MEKTLLAGPASSWKALALGLLLGTAAACAAQPKAQATGRKTSYAPTPPSYAAAAAASAGGLQNQVALLALNDQRQDQRLRHLEQDVSQLKPSGRPSQEPASRQIKADAPPKLHVVRSGETLWRIAAKYNTSINAIRVANRMTGDTVAVNQTLVIPTDDAAAPPAAPPNVHVVTAGETFSGIALRYRVTQDALAKANPSAYPDRLLVGERLSIPGGRPLSIPQYTASNPEPRRAAETAAHVHTVQRGESLGVIAKRYGLPTATLAAANKLKNPDLVEVGQKLTIPTAAPITPPATPVAKEQPRLVKHHYPAADEGETVPLPGAALPLKTPAVTPPAPVSAVTPAPPPAVAPPKTPSPMPAGSHRGVVAYRLEKGDDLEIVANMFSTTPAKIRELNMLGPNDALKEGDEVVVPALSPLSTN